ncbi:hypothetical protein D3C71_1396780 [compost metagenome]
MLLRPCEYPRIIAMDGNSSSAGAMARMASVLSGTPACFAKSGAVMYSNTLMMTPTTAPKISAAR